MSIITDALNKAQKRTAVRAGLKELEKCMRVGEKISVTTRGVRPKAEPAEGFFTSGARRLSEKKTLWGLRSAAGTLVIVGAAVLAFFYSTRFFSGIVYPAANPAAVPPPAVTKNPSAVIAAPDKAAPVVKAPADVKPADVKKIRQARRPYPFELSGIIGGDEPMAIIDGNIVKIGESIRGARLVSVSSDRVTILYKGKEVVLKID